MEKESSIKQFPFFQRAVFALIMKRKGQVHLNPERGIRHSKIMKYGAILT
jgi:hypothetical protein